jgi:hypothetical protein
VSWLALLFFRPMRGVVEQGVVSIILLGYPHDDYGINESIAKKQAVMHNEYEWKIEPRSLLSRRQHNRYSLVIRKTTDII